MKIMGASTLEKRIHQFFETYKDLPSMEQYYPTLCSPSTSHLTLKFKNKGCAKDYVNFSSSNYLNLSRRAEVRQAYISAYEEYGCGSNGSPVLSGYYKPHADLELALARFHDAPNVVLFPSGYCANLSIIASILGPQDMLFFDEAAHGSIIDGGKLGQTRMRSFRHNDPEDLRQLLKRMRHQSKLAIVATLGVFSMSGDTAPLPDIVRVAKEYEALVLLDDAHGVGVLGANGRGTLEHFGLAPGAIDFCVGTLSKTLGGIGGYVAADDTICDFLRHRARPHVLSANIPPSTAAGCLAAVAILAREGSVLAGTVRQKAHLFGQLMERQGVSILGKGTGVVATSVHDHAKLWHASQHLFERGVFFNPVLYPAVRKDEGRLRFYLNVDHLDADLERVAKLVLQALDVVSMTAPLDR